MRKVNYVIGNVTTTNYNQAKAWQEKTKIPFKVVLENIPEPLYKVGTRKYKTAH